MIISEDWSYVGIGILTTQSELSAIPAQPPLD